MAPDNDERLVALAAAVADCEPVDWASAESSAGSDDERRVIANLRVLAALGVVHRTETEDAELTHTAGLATTAAHVSSDSQAVPRWGPFLLLERLGGGSQGDVFRAVDTRLDRQVALKFLKRPAGEHVLSEARLLARVRHPNVVTVYGADLIDGRVGLWMELITGDMLDAIVMTRGPMSAAEATIVGVDLCRAVGAVHLAGLLHRDIKGQNVMRESGGRYVLMDFGTGHAVDDAARGSQTAGTPLYLAPEILNGEPASIQSDIYALGVLLFYLTSATYPATARSVGALTAQHREGHRRRLGETRSDLSPAFVAVIDRALDPNPRQRFRTAAEMAMALTRSMVGFLPADGDAPIAAPRSWRRPVLVMGLAVAVLAGALQLGSGLRSGSPPPITGPRTVAVLAFEDLSDDQRGRTLSEGLSDLLITDLGQQPALSVMARTSSRHFTGNRRALDLAREYGVNFIVEGSLRPNGRSWTVATRVVSASSGTLLGGFTLDTDLAHLGETVGGMAKSVTKTLQVPPRDVRATAPIDAQAMEAYVRGWSEYLAADAGGLPGSRAVVHGDDDPRAGLCARARRACVCHLPARESLQGVPARRRRGRREERGPNGAEQGWGESAGAGRARMDRVLRLVALAERGGAAAARRRTEPERRAEPLDVRAAVDGGKQARHGVGGSQAGSAARSAESGPLLQRRHGLLLRPQVR